MLCIAITGPIDVEDLLGHLPPHGGNQYNMEAYDRIKQDIIEYIKTLIVPHLNLKDPSDFIYVSGMARGVDEIWADIAMEYDAPLIIAVPNSIAWHKTRQPTRNNLRAQAINYDKILSYPNLRMVFEVKKVYRGRTFEYANFARNQCMVDISDYVVAYNWKGSLSRGTNDCIRRAEYALKYLGNIYDFQFKAHMVRQFDLDRFGMYPYEEDLGDGRQ